MEDGQYVDGLKNGPCVSFYANGNKMREGCYVRGKKEGVWIQYWENGNKKSEATFVADKYSGLYTAFHENGKRRWQGRYNEYTGSSSSADGTKKGVWLEYEEDGETVRRRMTYRRGSKIRPDEYPPFEDTAAPPPGAV